VSFTGIDKLKIGDEIKYTTFNGLSRTYEIAVITTIGDSDWSYLQNTEDNRITIITCVKNKPDQRLCIQGIEKI